MSILGWRVHFTRRGLAQPLTPSPLLKSLPDLDAWLDEHGVLDGETFLLDPCGRYDVELNRFFAGPLSLKARDTQAAVARDVKNFLNFLWFARGETGEKGWRDANPDDRVAYEKWRRKDPAGPRVQDASWDRERSRRSTASISGRSGAAPWRSTRSGTAGSGSTARQRWTVAFGTGRDVAFAAAERPVAAAEGLPEVAGYRASRARCERSA